MRLVVVLALAGCSARPVPSLEANVACGAAIDAVESELERVPRPRQYPPVNSVLALCGGTLSEKACAGGTLETCLAAYCDDLPTPRPLLCSGEPKNPLDRMTGVLAFVLAAKRYDLRGLDAVTRQRLLQPFEAHFARRENARKHLGCPGFGTILRLDTGSVTLYDGSSMVERARAAATTDDEVFGVTDVMLSGLDGGCSAACVVSTRDVRMGRFKQVMKAAGGRCVEELGVVTLSDEDATP